MAEEKSEDAQQDVAMLFETGGSTGSLHYTEDDHAKHQASHRDARVQWRFFGHSCGLDDADVQQPKESNGRTENRYPRKHSPYHRQPQYASFYFRANHSGIEVKVFLRRTQGTVQSRLLRTVLNKSS